MCCKTKKERMKIVASVCESNSDLLLSLNAWLVIVNGKLPGRFRYGTTKELAQTLKTLRGGNKLMFDKKRGAKSSEGIKFYSTYYSFNKEESQEVLCP